MQTPKTAAELTRSVRVPYSLLADLAALSDATETHPTGSRTVAELLTLAARQGLPALREVYGVGEAGASGGSGKTRGGKKSTRG